MKIQMIKILYSLKDDTKGKFVNTNEEFSKQLFFPLSNPRDE